MKKILTWLADALTFSVKPKKPAAQAAGPTQADVDRLLQRLEEKEAKYVELNQEYTRLLGHREAVLKERDALSAEVERLGTCLASAHKRGVEITNYAADLEQKFTRPFEARETAAAPPWEDEDRNNLRIFLGTNTGQRLCQGMNYWAQFKEQAATLTTENQAYQCGTAAGYRHFGTFVLHTLSADIRPQQDEDTRTRHGADDLRERHAP